MIASDARPNLLWIGDDSHDDFAPCVAVLDRMTTRTSRRTTDDATALPAEAAFELIIRAQAVPGASCDAEFRTLRARFPTASLIHLLGDWCVGEGRSNALRPPALRLAWHRAAAFFQRELTKLRNGLCPEFGRPPTQSDEEQLVDARSQSPTGAMAPDGVVAVFSRDSTAARWLHDACRHRYRSAFVIDEGRRSGMPRADVVLCDVERADQAPEAVDRCRERAPAAAVVALVGFLRSTDVRRLRAAGAEAVVAKPVLTADLWDVIDSALSSRSGAGGRG